MSFNDNRIRFFQNQNNGIIAVNRNFAIKQAKGKYVAFCDDDDLWMPEKLDKQLSFMERNKDIGLTYVPYSILKKDGSITGKFPKVKNIYRGNIFRLLYFKSIMANSGIIFRKSLIKEIGHLNENLEFVAMEDYDYWLKAALITKIDYIDAKPLLIQSEYSDKSIS